jgi:cobalt-zinc-cadmium efflux system outer membrane protein
MRVMPAPAIRRREWRERRERRQRQGGAAGRPGLPAAPPSPCRARRAFLASLALLAALACLRPAHAQPRWSEADVVRLAQQRAPEALLAAATVALAEAQARVTGTYPDPALAWEREALLGNGAARQDIVRAIVPVDPSRQRRVQRLLAQSRSAAVRAEAAEMRAEAIAQAVRMFHAALAAAQRAELLQQAVTDLDEAARVLARREEAGLASGYERDRLELEAELARSRASEARAEQQARHLALALLLAADPAAAPAPAPALPPAPPPAPPAPLDTLVAQALAARLAMVEARRAASAAGAAAATGWSWLPRIELSAGAQIAREEETRHGYVASLSFDVPVFSRGRALRAEAEGQRRLAAAHLAVIRQRITAEVSEARLRLVASQEELARFEQAVGQRVELLGSAAASGYREGQRTILELLDAQRIRTEVRLRRLELAYAVRLAELGLRRAVGEWQ